MERWGPPLTPRTSTLLEGKLVSLKHILPKRDYTVKKGILLARRLSVLDLSGKSTNTLYVCVTVDVATPVTNKSQ